MITWCLPKETACIGNNEVDFVAVAMITDCQLFVQWRIRQYHNLLQQPRQEKDVNETKKIFNMSPTPEAITNFNLAGIDVKKYVMEQLISPI